MARFAWNPFRRDVPDWSAPELGFVGLIREQTQRPLHRALPGYAPTPLRALPRLASEVGLGEILVKDESGRFGIEAFKALGASFALASVLRARHLAVTGEDLPVAAFARPGGGERLTIAAATDGNHGRAVAWIAARLGHAAVVFMPADAAAARVAHVEREGAEVRLVPGTFDDCVAACAEAAARKGWQVLADTAYAGNMEIPGFIMGGYATIFAELDEQTELGAVDAVFLPAGVGGLAAAGTAYLAQRLGAGRPRLVCVEPESSDCFLESIAAGDGEPRAARGDQSSVMVGLCCAMPSLLAWPVVRDGMDLFLAIEDDHALAAMRAYQREGITAGESGASSLAGLMALLAAPELVPARERLGLGAASRVLVVNTEGATDPEHYARVIGADESESESGAGR